MNDKAPQDEPQYPDPERLHSTMADMLVVSPTAMAAPLIFRNCSTWSR